MNPANLMQRYLTKYQLTLQHPEHGQMLVTSPVWPQHPDLQRAVQRALEGLAGVQTVTVDGPHQLTVRYDSTRLRQLNPLKLMAMERQLSQAYHQAGY